MYEISRNAAVLMTADKSTRAGPGDRRGRRENRAGRAEIVTGVRMNEGLWSIAYWITGLLDYMLRDVMDQDADVQLMGERA